MKTNIVLIGFMGAGKTSTGIRAANIAGYSFLETDREIEKYLNKKINDIFSIYGENYFREIESFICREAGKKENTIISCGGGVVKKKENIEYLKQNGIIVYLSAQPEHLYNNLKNDTVRPLLKNTAGADRLNIIKRLLEERCQAYEECADVVLNVTDKSIEEISKEIIILGGNK